MNKVIMMMIMRESTFQNKDCCQKNKTSARGTAALKRGNISQEIQLTPVESP